jgi:ribosomal-protein-alanine N-acetyltransferase
MVESHLDDIWEIECRAHAFPWKESLIRQLNSRGACHYTLVVHGNVAGYFYAQNIVGEVTLLNLAVDPMLHGQGYGERLIRFLLDHCEARQAESVWLEVRESNLAAYALYLKVGFHEVDRRIDYYPADRGREDALIMSCHFVPFG